jgi:uncharacterized repeat protein (TIGR02543 family)
MKKRGVINLVRLVLLASFAVSGCVWDEFKYNVVGWKTVTFDANGADSGTAPESQGVRGNSITLPGQGGLMKAIHTFGGWNIAPDGTGKSYQPGDSYTVTENITLYAQWVLKPYTVTYKAPGVDKDNVPVPQAVPAGGTDAERTITLADAPEWTGHTFMGWLTPEGTKQRGDKYLVTGNATFYAQWTDAYSIIYYPNNASDGGGEPFAVVTGVTGSVPVAYPEGLTRDGYVFVGWTEAKNGLGTRYRWDSPTNAYVTVVENNTLILYAQWGYSVTYDLNGATTGTPPPTAYLLPGETHRVAAPEGTLTKGSRKFIGWRLGAGADGPLYLPPDNDSNAPSDYKKHLSISDALDGNIDLYALYMGDRCEGGLVFYDKGSYSDDWRFLAAAPADLSVSGRIIYGGEDLADRFYFEKEFLSYDREFYENVTNVNVEALTDPAEGAAAIGEGKANTETLNNYTGNYGGVTLGGSAAYYCDTYVSGNKDDWFLPSIGELKALYTFVSENGNTPGLDTEHGVYWSSNQHYDITKAPEDLQYQGVNQAFEAWVLRFVKSAESWTGQFAWKNFDVWGTEGSEIPYLVPGVPSTHSKNALHKVRPVRRF